MARTQNITAIILLAGMGRRTKLLGEKSPKCLFDINNKPILWYSINNLLKFNVSKLVLVVGYQAEKIISFCKSSFPNLSIDYIYNDKFDTTNSIYSYYLSREHLLNANILRMEGDLLYTPGILKKVISQKHTPVSAVEKKVKKSEEEFSVEVEYHSKTIIKYGKEISIDKAFGEAKGIEYIQAKESAILYKFLNNYAINHLDDYAEMVYQNIIDQKKQKIFYVEIGQEDFWCEVDTEEDLKFARENYIKYI